MRGRRVQPPFAIKLPEASLTGRRLSGIVEALEAAKYVPITPRERWKYIQSGQGTLWYTESDSPEV